MSKDPSLRILIADSDPGVKTALRLFLGKDGTDVLDAEDGERALLIARTVPLDLVLCDVGLPKVDGLELLRSLRADASSRLRSLPVVLLAAHASPDLAARARTIGATEVVQKPLTTPAMAALLRRAQRRQLSTTGTGWSSVELQAASPTQPHASEPRLPLPSTRPKRNES